MTVIEIPEGILAGCAMQGCTEIATHWEEGPVATPDGVVPVVIENKIVLTCSEHADEDARRLRP